MERGSIDLSEVKKVFFYGIGGIGISAIARMMLKEGKKVFGQDTQLSPNTKLLEDLGAQITLGQDISTIPEDADVIVYSRAIEVLEPDFLKKIKTLPIPSLVYPQMLGLVSENKYTIAIAGAHGKTTTTGMVAHILQDLNLDPTVVIGSFLQDTQSNFIQGESKYFVVEADEYHRAFLNLHPKIGLIINIDLDHVDYYKDIDDIVSAFNNFVKKIPQDGYIICDPNGPHMKNVLEDISCNIVDYKKYLYERDLLLPGRHNQIDAALAFCVGNILGLEKEDIDKSLSTFSGTWRRFEKKGTTKTGALIYDDYAHHPTEVKASLQAFREKFPKGDYKINLIFQPHLFSRTKALFNEFIDSFSDADGIVILPIFKAREVDDGSISSQMLAQAISKNKDDVQSLSFEQTEKYFLEKKLTDKDIVITMGAGEAYRIGDKILALR